jgi:RNA polymerase sigma-70 factor, ECF subfamily
MVETRAVTLGLAPGAVPEDESARLLRLARSGDTVAFERLLILHERQVLRTALRLLGSPADAQDAAQDVFLRFHKHLGRVDAARGCSSWLYRITVNVCHDLLRRRRRGATTAIEDITEPSAPAEAETLLVREVESRIVAEALLTLPDKERAALVLRDIEGLPTCEVAGILGSSEATVRSQISSARLKIRKYAARYQRKRK